MEVSGSSWCVRAARRQELGNASSAERICARMDTFDEDGIREKASVKKSDELRRAKEKAAQNDRIAHQNVRAFHCTED